MNPHFGNAFTHRLVVTEIAFFRTVNTRLDPTGDLFVSQGVKPSVKNFGRVDRFMVHCINWDTKMSIPGHDADSSLLAALIAKGKFVDQEQFSF